MAVLQTVLIYLILILVLYLASRLAEQRNNFIYIVGAVFFYAIIFGLRSGVGVDFWGYKEWFDYSAAGFGAYKNMEPGFNLLINLCVKFGLPFSFFLGFIAFCQLLLIYLAIKLFNVGLNVYARVYLAHLCKWVKATASILYICVFFTFYLSEIVD
mgnify:CR=1 FL=1